jgi:eukaryotic-like serine/threonine-protein kinase
MSPAHTGPGGMELDDFVRAYEAAWACVERAELKAFLPERSHPLYRSVLREVVRVDLRFRWDRGQPIPLEEYRTSFPDIFSDREILHAITFEEYRLRSQRGVNVTPGEYERRFGVDVASWPSLHLPAPVCHSRTAACSPEDPSDPIARPVSTPPSHALSVDQTWCSGDARPDDAAGGPFRKDCGGGSQHSRACDELRRPEHAIASQRSRSVITVPQVGSEFLGFRLLAQLGSGAFGRVYLARQGRLADRLVVLKIAPHLFDESRTLAQLQHAHIVPIYSVHQADDLQAICMPFLGTTTFAEILSDLRGRSDLPESGRYLLDRIDASAGHSFATGGIRRAEPGGSQQSYVRHPVESLTYVDAILWLMTRVADGLAHAHERGIVHRDVKPANILLTDDCVPMLLDFNLSDDTKLDLTEAATRVGGTMRYMAPEQLAASQTGTCPGNERTDVYSFGVILHELLTGRHPFPLRNGQPADMPPDAATKRHRPPEVRRRNRAVSPGTESIVHQCLEPETSRRYQNAREIHEDLRRQSESLPLKYAPEPSLREWARKWTRRHPRLSSSTAVGSAATLLILAVASAFLLRIGHLRRLSAEQAAVQTRLTAVAARQRLHDDLKAIEFLLGSDVHGSAREQRETGTALAQEAVDRYRILKSPRWQESPLVSALLPAQREQVREDMGELLLLLAGAVAEQKQLDLALRINEVAAGCYPADAVPRAIWRQRALLVRAAGQSDLAQRLVATAEATPVQSPRDRYLLLLTEYRQLGRFQDALPWLQEASRHQKDNFSVWLNLGICSATLGKWNEAVECYDMARALWPESHWPSLCQGLAYLEEGNDRRALAAFDEVIRLRPETKLAYYNRALAEYRLGDLPAARTDLTHLLSQPDPSIRAYLLRAKVRAKQGDREGAHRDQEDGLRLEPRDEYDLTARGLARQPRDPQGALADFESALKLNPRYLTALQNKVNVLAEDLGRTDEAVATLDTLLALYPDYVPALAGRGVLLARLGRREAAHADAREALPLDTKPFNIYQVAGIYALTSRQNPDDRREALRLLESALSQGFGLELIDIDHDLDAIRDQPEFRRLVEAARARHAKAPRAAVQQRGLAGDNGSNNAPSG